MKITSASTLVILFGARAAVACGGSEALLGPVDERGTLDGGGENAGSGDPNGSKQCVSSCTSDSQCASSCPVTDGATQCCDLGTKTCFRARAALCLMTDPDAGPTVPQY